MRGTCGVIKGKSKKDKEEREEETKRRERRVNTSHADNRRVCPWKSSMVTRRRDAHGTVDPYPVKRMNKPSRQNETRAHTQRSTNGYLS